MALAKVCSFLSLTGAFTHTLVRCHPCCLELRPQQGGPGRALRRIPVPTPPSRVRMERRLGTSLRTSEPPHPGPFRQSARFSLPLSFLSFEDYKNAPYLLQKEKKRKKASLNFHECQRREVVGGCVDPDEDPGARGARHESQPCATRVPGHLPVKD